MIPQPEVFERLRKDSIELFLSALESTDVFTDASANRLLANTSSSTTTSSNTHKATSATSSPP